MQTNSHHVDPNSAPRQVSTVNNYLGDSGASEQKYPRDFGKFDDFPLVKMQHVFGNDIAIAKLCYESFDGTTASVAMFSQQLIKGQYLLIDDKWYFFNGKYWKSHPPPHTFVFQEVVPIYNELQNHYTQDIQIKWLQHLVSDLKNISRQKGFIEELENILKAEENIPSLDDNNNLIPFNNGVFDTKNLLFRSHQWKDFTSRII
ncbi:hypothetical protein BDK51DRAFT_30535 [Blyttiomyces helicus]|uniref:Bacteriophage/plasmid primase P4 C-terminal domain-containing protein n=1 Tax=Blyttiomyces helicus TaxID=388810 RepID=A0A4P9WBV5_9FUNG|nr:hypothetical protein BDK51DRAFT_30535 [Blyttiomyces helicus]|eukprot:RKO88648.1 hypothetical protein BDK51DRAFT_30535 [Blyttiomyces helicus]